VKFRNQVQIPRQIFEQVLLEISDTHNTITISEFCWMVTKRFLSKLREFKKEDANG
jgi:hypothetical protein